MRSLDNPEYESVASETGPSEILRASPGELSKKIESEAEYGDVVKLDAGAVYDPGQRIDIPGGVNVDFNSAIWRPQSPYDGFYVAPEASLIDSTRWGAKLDASNVDYTDQTAILLDTSIDGRYAETGYETNVFAQAYQDNHQGTALKLDATEGAITIGTRIGLNCWRFNRGVDMYCEGSFINFPDFQVALAKNTTDVYYHALSGTEGSTDNSAFVLDMHGWTQTGSGSEYGFRSETESGANITDGPRFFGQFWDANGYSTAAVDAEQVFIKTTTAIYQMQGNLGPNASGVAVGHRPGIGAIRYLDLGDDTMNEERWDSGTWQFRTGGNRTITFYNNRIDANSKLKLNGNRLYRVGSMEIREQDLGSLSPSSSENGEIYRHDGSSSINADGGTTSSSGIYAWDNSASEFKSVVQF